MMVASNPSRVVVMDGSRRKLHTYVDFRVVNKHTST